MTESRISTTEHNPRVIVYYQTHHNRNTDSPISLLPLIANKTGLTHLIIAAVHINEDPTALTLNDHPPDHPRNHTLWSETTWLRATGIKILAMLGGAAKGTFSRLDTPNPETFEAYYTPLYSLIKAHRLDGIDLDIEEPMSLSGIIRLIDRLRSDFGPDFLITLAPVATALLPGNQKHLSGFDYAQLELQRGGEIAWYNAQFYCGWGDASTTVWYDAIVAGGWKPEKVVLGLVTNPVLGAGFVPGWVLEGVLRLLKGRYERFGGVMGWEYFCGLPGGEERPWEWVREVAGAMRGPVLLGVEGQGRERDRATGDSASILPVPAHPFPGEHIKFLQELGFGLQQAVAALNMTKGDVDQAAGLLFEE